VGSSRRCAGADRTLGFLEPAYPALRCAASRRKSISPAARGMTNKKEEVPQSRFAMTTEGVVVPSAVPYTRASSTQRGRMNSM
jgi:hypothetical protein